MLGIVIAAKSFDQVSRCARSAATDTEIGEGLLRWKLLQSL